MPLIHYTALEGSPEKSVGSAALSSVALVDIGVTGGAGGAGGCLGGAGGAVPCLGIPGVEGRSSLSLFSGWLSP